MAKYRNSGAVARFIQEDFPDQQAAEIPGAGLPEARAGVTARDFAKLGGASMLAMGLASWIPSLSQSAESARLPALRVQTSYGKFLGLFPLNVFNKSALCLFGIAGVLASRAPSERAAVNYARAVAIAMGPLAVLGAIPRTRTLFGYWPLFGNEVLTHGNFAALGTYFGFIKSLKRA
jgi:hypothetical protein